MPRSPNALDVLRRDHKKVLTLFHRFEKTDDESEQRELCDEIVNELTAHADIEEGVFYPYLREATAREDLFEEATLEHETTKDLLAKLQEEQPGTPRFQAMVKVLGEYVAHHVKEEESEIFPQVEKTGVDLEALGLELEDRRSGGPGVGGGSMRSALSGDGAEAQAASATAEGEDDSEAVEAASEDAGLEDNRLDTAEEDEQYVAEHAGELSRSTERAKWIHSLDDQPDHDGQTLATRNPAVIHHWAQERRARPATTANGDPKRPHVLRFDFPEYDQGLQEISWDAWLRTFEERDLVFLFQERMKAGNQSNFFILDTPEREDG